MRYFGNRKNVAKPMKKQKFAAMRLAKGCRSRGAFQRARAERAGMKIPMSNRLL